MRAKRSHNSSTQFRNREYFLLGSIILGLVAISIRLFYWQIINGSLLRVEAQDQYQTTLSKEGGRGSIYTADGHLLVGNTTSYRLFAHPHLLKAEDQEIVDSILPLVLADLKEFQEATEEAELELMTEEIEARFNQQLGKEDSKWVSLQTGLTRETREAIANLDIQGLGFEPQAERLYPEASLAAHVTGLVGHNDQGKVTGYFGIEGALNKELQARTQKTILNTDALGFKLSSDLDSTTNQGRDIVLTVRRDLQYLAESFLDLGMERYGASAGEIIIAEPQTGKVLALATAPKYDQATFNQYEPYLYKNPALSNLFEPGSIIKTLTVAAGIDAGKIEPDTECPNCDGPRVIDKYTIKTWNEEYNPNINMTDALAKSDNIAMIYVAEELGSQEFSDYLKKFGFGEALDIDLQEDVDTPFPEKWGPVELATTSFGQGISANSMQMVRAVSTIANQGVMMQPMIVEKVIDPDSGEEIVVKPKSIRKVIHSDTARQVTEMMVHAAKSGEAQWTYSKTHSIAGKTGTSQVAAEGGYAEDKTIASFIGFAPPQDPKFIMLVKLVEPQSSPWAAETAAPLWYKVAEKLFLLLNIAPD